MSFYLLEMVLSYESGMGSVALHRASTLCANVQLWLLLWMMQILQVYFKSYESTFRIEL